MRSHMLLLVPIIFAGGCSSSSAADPVFESTSVSDVAARGGDCAEHRCVSVTAPVVGSREGEGTCAIYGPGDPESLEPLAESGHLEMSPGDDVVWTTKLPEDAPATDRLNPVCEPMIEG